MYFFKKGVIRLEFVVVSEAFIFFQLVANARPVNTDPDKMGHDRTEAQTGLLVSKGIHHYLVTISKFSVEFTMRTHEHKR